MHRVFIVLASISVAWVFRLIDAAWVSGDEIELSPKFFDITFDLVGSAAVTMIIVGRVVRSPANDIRNDVARASWGYFAGFLLGILVVRYAFPKLDVLGPLLSGTTTTLVICNILGGLLLAHASYLDETKRQLAGRRGVW